MNFFIFYFFKKHFIIILEFLRLHKVYWRVKGVVAMLKYECDLFYINRVFGIVWKGITEI